MEILERICAVSVYSTAARELGLDDVSYQRTGIELFDGVAFNGDDPITYINSLSIHQTSASPRSRSASRVRSRAEPAC